MSRTRVFHLIKSLGRGGAETLLSQAWDLVDRDRFEVAYGYFLPWKNQIANELRAKGAEVTCFGGNSSPQVLIRTPLVARHLLRWKANIIHAHLPVSGACARVAGKAVGVPVVYTEHNLQERYRPATRRLNLSTWRLQARMLAVSEEVAASARKHAGDRVPIEVVVNGVDVERFQADAARRDAARRELNLSPDTFLVGTCAVFRVQKRLEWWLEAASAIAAEFPDARFLLVGDGPLRGDVEGWIRERGLAERVIMPGLQEDVRDFVDAMDVFFMSSDFEGLPVAMLEAMSMATPIIATAVGGIADVLLDEAGGIVVPKDDLGGLVDALRLLARAPGHRIELGKRGRARVQADFSMERMQRQLESIYTEVAKR